MRNEGIEQLILEELAQNGERVTIADLVRRHLIGDDSQNARTRLTARNFVNSLRDAESPFDRVLVHFHRHNHIITRGQSRDQQIVERGPGVDENKRVVL